MCVFWARLDRVRSNAGGGSDDAAGGDAGRGDSGRVTPGEVTPEEVMPEQVTGVLMTITGDNYERIVCKAGTRYVCIGIYIYAR